MLNTGKAKNPDLTISPESFLPYLHPLHLNDCQNSLYETAKSYELLTNLTMGAIKILCVFLNKVMSKS